MWQSGTFSCFLSYLKKKWPGCSLQKCSIQMVLVMWLLGTRTKTALPWVNSACPQWISRRLTFGIVELDISKLNHRRVASSWQHPSRSIPHVNRESFYSKRVHFHSARGSIQLLQIREAEAGWWSVSVDVKYI